MKVKTPKVLERSPEVAGFTLDKVVVAVLCFLGVISFGYYNILAALFFVLFGAGYFFFLNKFSAKGEFYQFLRYHTGKRCICGDIKIKSLTNKIRRPMKKTI